MLGQGQGGVAGIAANGKNASSPAGWQAGHPVPIGTGTPGLTRIKWRGMGDPLEVEETRRSEQHQAVKAQVEGEVQGEIADHARQAPQPGEARKIDQVAGQFRAKAVDEVVTAERDVARGRGAARTSQIVDYVFFLVYALLGMRFLLALLAARSSAGFVKFIVAVTNPLYAPFENIVASPSSGDGHTLMLPIGVAIVAYVMLHLAVNGLLRMLAHRKTQI
jgi:hypothetical protein